MQANMQPSPSSLVCQEKEEKEKRILGFLITIVYIENNNAKRVYIGKQKKYKTKLPLKK